MTIEPQAISGVINVPSASAHEPHAVPEAQAAQPQGEHRARVRTATPTRAVPAKAAP